MNLIIKFEDEETASKCKICSRMKRLLWRLRLKMGVLVITPGHVRKYLEDIESPHYRRFARDFVKPYLDGKISLDDVMKMIHFREDKIYQQIIQTKTVVMSDKFINNQQNIHYE